LGGHRRPSGTRHREQYDSDKTRNQGGVFPHGGNGSDFSSHRNNFIKKRGMVIWVLLLRVRPAIHRHPYREQRGGFRRNAARLQSSGTIIATRAADLLMGAKLQIDNQAGILVSYQSMVNVPRMMPGRGVMRFTYPPGTDGCVYT
jgi:hypothetical protein